MAQVIEGAVQGPQVQEVHAGGGDGEEGDVHPGAHLQLVQVRLRQGAYHLHMAAILTSVSSVPKLIKHLNNEIIINSFHTDERP